MRALYDIRVQCAGRRIRRPRRRAIGARRYGKEVAIRARRGVVLATGSFAYNDAMVAQYAPRIAGRPAASIEQHDGQAIRMAQALGADLAHMDATEVAFFIDPQQLVRGILVNGRGQRYVPEDTYSGPGRPVDPLSPEQHGVPDHRRGRPGGGDGRRRRDASS